MPLRGSDACFGESSSDVGIHASKAKGAGANCKLTTPRWPKRNRRGAKTTVTFEYPPALSAV
jgi:hypothetical protein